MEKLNLKSMIESVIEDLSNNADVNSFAFKVKLIANKLNNAEFSEWVKNELEGYSNGENLPKYRIITTYVIATIIVPAPGGIARYPNQRVPLSNFGDMEVINQLSTIWIKESIIILEGHTKTDFGQNMIHGSALNEWELMKVAEIYENASIQSACKVLNKSNFEEIIFKFKSTLLDMFMGFDETIFNDEIDFDIMAKKRDIEKIVNQTINAGQYFNNSSATFNDSPVVTGDNNTINITQQTKNEIGAIVNRIEELSRDIEDDREDIATEIAKIRTELNSPTQRPKVLRSAFNALKGISTGVAANMLTPLINDALTKL